jgi:hypothetical protein
LGVGGGDRRLPFLLGENVSYITMAKSLAQGEIPGVALELAKSKINDALGKVYDETVWSFQLGSQGGWLIPGLVASTGTFTTTAYSNQVIADATASAVIAAMTGRPLITELQFRNPAYALYDIVGYAPPTGGGVVNGIFIASPGGGYVVGQQLQVNQGAVTGCIVQITGVNGTGGVTGASLLSGGSGGYATTAFTVTTGGSGIGCEIGVASVTPQSLVVLTLDRPWMEPPVGPGMNYYIYQAYFPVPVQDFRSFVEIRDTTDGDYVSFWGLSQDDLSVEDPERVVFGPALPTYAVPLGIDPRPNSATPGWMRYEVWPHILSRWPLSFTFKRRGTLLVNPNDTVPYPLTEELVTFRAKEVLYQYKEAQKGENQQRGSGADWRFLAEMARVEYSGKDGTGGLLKKIRAIDANLHRDFLTRPKRRPEWTQDGFSTNRLGQLNVGSF